MQNHINMKKFCCVKFGFHYETSNSTGLNFRVVKLSDEFIKRGEMKIDRSFMITEGYTDHKFMECKHIVMQHCPFCGTKLHSFYKSDEYVQEILDVPKRKEPPKE